MHYPEFFQIVLLSKDITMAEPAGEIAATGDAGPVADQAVNQGFFSIAKGLMIRALMIYFITSFFR